MKETMNQRTKVVIMTAKRFSAIGSYPAYQNSLNCALRTHIILVMHRHDEVLPCPSLSFAEPCRFILLVDVVKALSAVGFEMR